ncbi:ATP-binding protein, partial [Kitasatospora sp. NPDC048540]|uniref:ATP-binding protein n=1 Tax=Kitasatospora sp. NPDC048540 TaxID=3155634 RepID=UPI00340C15AD
MLLPYEPSSAAAARRLVRSTLRAWDLHDLVEAGEPVVSELVGNAVKTGCRRRMLVSVERITGGRVRISVCDGSRTMPCRIDAGPDAESGRGMALVHHLTAASGASPRNLSGRPSIRTCGSAHPTRHDPGARPAAPDLARGAARRRPEFRTGALQPKRLAAPGRAP